MSAEVELLLDRLDRVKPNGSRGWTARCPSHEDRMSSLSVSEGAGGKVLVHCFAGCASLDVVQAVGLTLTDLFPRRLSSEMSHDERQQLHERSMRSKWSAALDVIVREAAVVSVAAAIMSEGRRPGAETMKRLTDAVNMIYDARTVLKTGPNRPRLPLPRREPQ